MGFSAQMLLPLPDGISLLGLSPPDVQSVTADVTGTGCQSPRGSLTITNTVGPAFNLGVGSFTPTQFFLSADGAVAYILGQSAVGSTTAPLPFIISFNIQAGTTSLISLAGNAVPLSAALNRSGNLLVGANDESVHVIDTSTGLRYSAGGAHVPAIQFVYRTRKSGNASYVCIAHVFGNPAECNHKQHDFRLCAGKWLYAAPRSKRSGCGDVRCWQQRTIRHYCGESRYLRHRNDYGGKCGRSKCDWTERNGNGSAHLQSRPDRGWSLRSRFCGNSVRFLAFDLFSYAVQHAVNELR